MSNGNPLHDWIDYTAGWRIKHMLYDNKIVHVDGKDRLVLRSGDDPQADE